VARGETQPTDRVPGAEESVATDADELAPTTGNGAIDSALILARRTSAEALLILAPKRVPAEVIRAIPTDLKVVVGVAHEDLEAHFRELGCKVVSTPGRFRSRTAQARHALFQARTARLLGAARRVVVVTAAPGRQALSSVSLIDLDLEFEEAAVLDRAIQQHGMRADVLANLLDVAIEIGMFGVEGREIGTILVYGATGQVQKRSRQLTFNPYHGYAERSRSVAEAEVRESLKIFAQMDGAILIRNDGVVAAAGRFLLVPAGEQVTVRGRGTRHQAGAFITRVTPALAIVVSETSGEVTIFADGKPIYSLSPRARR
jgi:DNA integrity scanning protein DisA with diadenylate cyclase activity